MSDYPRISERTERYPFPRTDADMRAAREAQAAEQKHDVPTCSYKHGPMVARDLATQTYEQMFCGLWWDCQSCNSSVSYTSRELAFEHGEPYAGPNGWEKWDGAAWVAITDAEADAYWAARAAWQESRQPVARRRPRKARRSAA